MDKYIVPVALDKALRIINHGPTTLISARHNGVQNVMAAAWACPLDFSPPKLTVVLDKVAKTRELLEQSGTFVVQIPTVAQLNMTCYVGTHSLAERPDKLERAGAELFEIDGFDLPFVKGCSAWLACKLIPESHNQERYDLFIGEIIGAWADTHVFYNGRWHYESADLSWRSLHHVAGGHFYAVGEALDLISDESNK